MPYDDCTCALRAVVCSLDTEYEVVMVIKDGDLLR